MEVHAAAGDVEAALACGRAVLAQEPLHEWVCRRMMEILAAHGKRARPLVLYREFEARLRRELNVAPDPATRALRANLLAEPRTR
jgi:DNA-binding SARP family transcriptional activator